MYTLKVILKNCESFELEVESPMDFYSAMAAGIDPKAKDNLLAENNCMINVGEIAAIHPVTGKKE